MGASKLIEEKDLKPLKAHDLECYCKGSVVSDFGLDDTFQCKVCKKHIHHKCLEDPPGTLILADPFVTFFCRDCTSSGKEKHLRETPSWKSAVVMALHHIIAHRRKEPPDEVPYRFVCRKYLTSFIGKAWDVLCYERKPSITWRNTISSILSTNSCFVRGSHEINLAGYWSLIPDFKISDLNSQSRGVTAPVDKEDDEDEDDYSSFSGVSLIKDTQGNGRSRSIRLQKAKEKLKRQELEQRKYLSDSAARRVKRKSLLNQTKDSLKIPRFNLAKLIIDDKILATPWESSFAARLFGKNLVRNQSYPRISPYHGTQLKPLLWQLKLRRWPPKLELLASFNSHVRPIDFIFFTSSLLPQVNQLLSALFWEGIDMSEALQYPDYSIIALYNNLVVGCAFMTPDHYITYLAVAPGWEQCGIGTTLLHLLIYQARGHDLTLHVSTNNPALILYQKFGFKPEQFLVNFYDKYLSPATSKLHRNALFVRLRS